MARPTEDSHFNLGIYNPHDPPHYARLLRVGLPGIRDHARARTAHEIDPERREFLEAVAIAYDAACRYVAKHARRAAELAATERDPRRRGELEQIAAVCDELAAGPPSSFHAALQLVQFTRIFGASGCIGRFDQWMYPFYERDVSAGILTRQEAQELLECFLIKLNHFGTACEPPFYVVPWSWGWTAQDGDAGGEGGLEIWDVGNPLVPVRLSVTEIYYYGAETPVQSVEVYGNYAITENSWGYVHSLDVS